MLPEEDKICITIPEGGTNNYIKGFSNSLGGKVDGNQLLIKQGPVDLQLTFYTIEGIEFNYVEINTKKPLLIKRTPDNAPHLLHLNIVTNASFTRRYQLENTVIDGNSQGSIFLYNGMFPAEGDFPANTNLKYLGFKINLESLGPIYEGLAEVFSDLFKDEEGLAYHAPLSLENERLISDLFAFDKLPNAKVPLISARALEVLTNVALHFKNEVDKDELAGLHIDDYNTLNTIKKKIVTNLETSYTIDELSKEFAVSPTKLKKDFKHLFGTSIYQFYTQARMDEAYRRLKSGQYSVSEVGYDLGYSSLSKFSSMFKKVKGILPTEIVKPK